MRPPAQVLAVHACGDHTFSKLPQDAIRLVAGWGVQGDAHAGVTVQHRSRVAKDPTQANLRQVHLLPCELFEELRVRGFVVAPGAMGENITTAGVDLLALPADAELQLGAAAVLRITGLRNPCRQIDALQRGLMAAVLDRAADGALVRKAGVMAVVVRGGVVAKGDAVSVVLPALPHRPLQPA